MAGTPTDQLTGDLITAAIYNARVGASGDSHQLWVHHDHATAVGAGDGAYLGAVACLAAGIYPLGQKLGAGRRIEVKLSAELTAAAGGSTTATLTWDTAFGTACEMVLMTVVQSSGDTTYFYGCQVDSMSTTNCVVRLFGGFGTKVAKIVAVGIGY